MKIELITIGDTENRELKKVIEYLEAEKKSAIANGDEDKANNCWLHLESLDLNILFIRAFNNIKLKNYRQAWYELEQCEIKESYIRENSYKDHIVASRLDFIKSKVSKWQSLYPYCLFFSPGFKVGYYSCSICGHKVRPRSRCEHKKGKVYSGQLCVHEAHDMEVLEVSIVTKPVQKSSVMHDDSSLDFMLLERLSSCLDNAFEDWDVRWTKIKFPIARFSKVSKKDKCPCKSDKSFEVCCMGKKEVEIPHVDFLFSKPLSSDAENIVFPYDNG